MTRGLPPCQTQSRAGHRFATGPLGNPVPARFVRPDGTFVGYTVDDLTDAERATIGAWMDANHVRLVAAVTGRLTDGR